MLRQVRPGVWIDGEPPKPKLRWGFDFDFTINAAGELVCTIGALDGEARAVLVNGLRYVREELE
jgi:hypothetical protein